jgi:hypothetical protein
MTQLECRQLKRIARSWKQLEIALTDAREAIEHIGVRDDRDGWDSLWSAMNLAGGALSVILLLVDNTRRELPKESFFHD